MIRTGKGINFPPVDCLNAHPIELSPWEKRQEKSAAPNNGVLRSSLIVVRRKKTFNRNPAR